MVLLTVGLDFRGGKDVAGLAGTCTRMHAVSRCGGPQRPDTSIISQRQRKPMRRMMMPADEAATGEQMLAVGRYSLMMESVHQNTWNTYSRDFKMWVQWRNAREEPLFVEDDVSLTKRQDDIIDFYVHHSYTCNYAPATIWVWIYAVRFMHQLYERDLDLVPMRRLKMVIHGWQRLHGAAHRKIPVTPQLIREVYLNGGLSMGKWNDLMVMLGIVLAFSFLWRSCEYSQENGRIDADKCLRVKDGLFSLEGSDINVVAPAPIEEFSAFHRTSKADFLHQGASNNIFADESGVQWCPIRLLNIARVLRPQHFAQGDHWLLQCSDGKPVSKVAVQRELKAGAVRLGLPEEHVTSHSLRAGGATTMWAMGKSEAYIMARGRWKSMCWKLYVWGSRMAQKGLSTGMFNTAVSLFAAVSAACGTASG